VGLHPVDHAEFASILGDKRWNDKSSDLSLAAIEKDLARTREFLARFEALDTSGFPDQERLNQQLMVRGLEEQIAESRFRNWEMPVSQISGIHLLVPQFVSLLQFDTAKDYDDLLVRYGNIPQQFDQTIEQMRSGMQHGLMPPSSCSRRSSRSARAWPGHRSRSRPSRCLSPSSPRTFRRPSRSAFARP